MPLPYSKLSFSEEIQHGQGHSHCGFTKWFGGVELTHVLISLRNAVLVRESVILKVLCAISIKRYTEVPSVQGRWLREGMFVCMCVCVCACLINHCV